MVNSQRRQQQQGPLAAAHITTGDEDSYVKKAEAMMVAMVARKLLTTIVDCQKVILWLLDEIAHAITAEDWNRKSFSQNQRSCHQNF